MGGDPELIAGELKVEEGAHVAVGLVGNVRSGIIKTLVIPPGRRNQGNPALHGQACSPHLLRTPPQGIENAHPSDGNPFTIVSTGVRSLESMANRRGWNWESLFAQRWDGKPSFLKGEFRRILGRPIKRLMQHERAFGKLAVEG